MDIDHANIHNLTGLWKKYGAHCVMQQGGSQLMASDTWPYRAWVEGKSDLALQLLNTPKTHRLSRWPYASCDVEHVSEQWQFEFAQTAMYLPLHHYQATAVSPTNHLHMQVVKDECLLRDWLTVCSDAFGYEIDANALLPLLTEDDVTIFLGVIENQPALSALLYRTDNVIGLHQMAVSQKFQGRGLAQVAMHFLLSKAKSSGAEYMVLQASEAGLPVYSKLGFQTQFTLKHYLFEDSQPHSAS
ncbi:GNAT family N-acetyltransferase [Aestuariibacter sp. AA17]|uniref:GNAT family N-acetyltransferase n=1 Tax=Fluctibacter corallii TaxID=2984329 RepID=A0ABT3A431_9ALTE|nr:GNAT family N-acetyltransferase [Aestuariibacter sp. AA17]MCV2883421.1 GNAT family N-acetyltransferase [Aestuariibacter sp. AA17]